MQPVEALVRVGLRSKLEMTGLFICLFFVVVFYFIGFEALIKDDFGSNLKWLGFLFVCLFVGFWLCRQLYPSEWLTV